jgi:hypothetical protein
MVVATEEAIIGNVNHLSKSASSDYSCAGRPDYLFDIDKELGNC